MIKRVVYPLIAAALITITPFLSTFEKGQDIVRGLIGYSILALLLLFMLVRDKGTIARKPLMGLVLVALFLVAVVDLQNLMFCKGWSMGWRIVIPVITCSLAVMLLKPVKSFGPIGISLFLFLVLVSHFFMKDVHPSQPLCEFPVAWWLERTAPNEDWARNNLTKEFRERNHATDSVSVTRYYVDTTRNNVVVLVESWGIPMDSNMFAKELSVFGTALKEYGIHFRMYSRTRTAEREDLLDSTWRDSTRRRDSLFMPRRFAGLGYQTTFLFGGDSTLHHRHKYIANIGFQRTFWGESAGDSLVALKVDSLLSDSGRLYIAWTTRDTQFPISDDPVETEKLYFERLFGTLQIVADLAKKHHDVRFVVQGDHEPILSPLEFQHKFYRRWVPFVVLN